MRSTPVKKTKKAAKKNQAKKTAMPKAFNRTGIWRIHQIDAMLRAGKTPSPEYLAEKLETSRRTIDRDIRFLRYSLDRPIEFDPVRGGYYYTKEAPPLPDLPFTEGDLFGFCIMEQMLTLFRGTELETQLRSTFEKLASGLTEQLSVSWESVAEAISFRATSNPIPVDPELLDAARRAVMDHEEVEFLYLGLHDDIPLKRHVEPFHLMVRDGMWYLFTHDLEAQDTRNFCLLRMQEFRGLGKYFEKGERHVHPETRLQHSIGIFSGDKPELVHLRLNKLGARLLSERSFHPTQKITRAPDGQHELTMHVHITPELERWVMNYWSEVEVLAPVSLREQIQANARAVLAWQKQNDEIRMTKDE